MNAPAAARAGAPTLIGSVQRALRLLEAVGSHRNGASAKQLAREAGLPLATTYHLLRTLAHEGYLHRENGVFRLGASVPLLARDEALQNRRSKIVETLRSLCDRLGAPVYFAVYRDGEIELVSVADSPQTPAVEEWVDFRTTGHAHAIGQCLLSQLDAAARRDHLDRHPVFALTAHSVRSEGALLTRLAALDRTARDPLRPVIERQEYVLGTVCAALPMTVGATPAAMAISVPHDKEERLLPTVERLRREISTLLTSGTFSISM
ncbi:IclR family transcriptional regulator C-terminal domain-containing protein [Streptomyces tremellae]|uniref:IclR family transcriptional regulator C-terminal domain-containing protein n=1 Tax=Streptomyces tremellae TaxID=1124239 RepID=A0ABP7ER32_9ACTN